MTANDAQDKLQRTAAAVIEASEEAAISRFMERLSTMDDADELTAALAMHGALSLIRAAAAAELRQDKHVLQDVSGASRRLAARRK